MRQSYAKNLICTIDGVVLVLCNPLKIATFVVSKDVRLRRAGTVKSKGVEPWFDRFVDLRL